MDEELPPGSRLAWHWALAEGLLGVVGLVVLVTAFVMGWPLGVILGGLAISGSGAAGLAHGELSPLQLRVLVSRDVALRRARMRRWVGIVVGAALALLGALALVG